MITKERKNNEKHKHSGKIRAKTNNYAALPPQISNHPKLVIKYSECRLIFENIIPVLANLSWKQQINYVNLSEKTSLH